MKERMSYKKREYWAEDFGVNTELGLEAAELSSQGNFKLAVAKASPALIFTLYSCTNYFDVRHSDGR
jgi:hypothetical protein